MNAVQKRVRTRTRPVVAAVQAALPGSDVRTFASHDLVVEYRAPAELKFNSRRAKRHPRKKIERLMASIRRLGFNTPVAVDGKGVIIAGHARVVAALELGLERIPAVYLSHLSDQQIREFMLADNKLAEGSEWDLDVLRVELAELAVDLDYNFELIGFDDVEVDVILHGDDESAATTGSDRADILPALRKRPVTYAADLWQLGAGRLICGDARDALVYERLLGNERVQLVVTDSPYNVRVADISGLGQHQHREFAMASGEMTPAEFTDFLRTVFTHLATVLRRWLPSLLVHGSSPYGRDPRGRRCGV